MNLARQTREILAIILSAIMLASCGALEQADDSTDESEVSTPSGATSGSGAFTTVAADSPSDSTGQTGSVELDFSSQLPTSSSLALATAETIDLGSGLVISDARVNIAVIKLKASKEKSQSERDFRKQLKAQKKVFEKEIELQKNELEKEKEAVKEAFESKKEGASESELDSLKDQLKIDLAAVKRKLGDLEATKDEKEQEFEIENDKNVKWKGPYLFNLVTGEMDPELPTIETTDGSYRRIEFKIKPNRTAESTDAMLNNSIVVVGTYNDTPVQVGIPLSEEFRMSGTGAFAVEAGVSNKLNIAFSLASWFEGVDLSTASVVDGAIEISKISNKSLMTQTKKSVKRSTKFGKDEDGDGVLGEDEDEGDGEENLADLEAEEEESEDEDSDDGSEEKEQKEEV